MNTQTFDPDLHERKDIYFGVDIKNSTIKGNPARPFTPDHTPVAPAWVGVEVFEPTMPEVVTALVLVRGLDADDEVKRNSGVHQRAAKALSALPNAICSGYGRSRAEVVLRLPNLGTNAATTDPAYDSVFSALWTTHAASGWDVEVIIDPSRFDFAINPATEIHARASITGHQHPEGRETCECDERGVKYAEKQSMYLGIYAGPLYSAAN